MASAGTTKRIFETINLVLAKNDGASFSFLQSEMNIPKSSMHSIIKELCSIGVLYYNEKTKGYMIGSEFVQLSARCMAQVNFVREINTAASDLCSKANITVSAGILRDRHIIYIVEHLERAGSRLINVGLTFPAHTMSMGKVLLSTLDDDELRTLYKDNRFEAYTDLTIKNMKELMAAVAEIRNQGYATDIGEFAPSIGCLSVPVYQGDKAVAALSVTTNVAMLTDEFIEEHLKLLRQASTEATRRMGGALSTSPF